METTNTVNLWEVRKALKPFLGDGVQTVLFGCSGGADSMALGLALFLERANIKVIPVVIDHGLQPGSDQISAQTALNLKEIGYTQIESAKAQVVVTDGIEASARRARYQIFNQFIDSYQPEHFFLAHTLNDQAETVLLGLARGSGARSLSGMAVRNNIYTRPLLKISRQVTLAACKEGGINIWSDPHNEDLRFSRIKVRKNVLPNLEENLGPGVVQALARSADLLRDDADALDSFANQFITQVDPLNLEVKDLERLPRALRTRILRLAIYQAGAPVGTLTAEHIFTAEALISDWHGQKELSLPGNVKLLRNSGRITLSTTN
ncbi:MAG: tRNA lysidine(34) synthetase TilS [Candidatus Nanopelagicus sp.]|nr:tRNA lysidine(34) synthetase TilS [Candidatus Nanopelagicus sp.]